MLLYACSFYYRSPGRYNYIRECGDLELPHPNHICKLCLSSEIDIPGIKDSHVSYLKERLTGLKEEEKLVSILLDEIQVKY